MRNKEKNEEEKRLIEEIRKLDTVCNNDDVILKLMTFWLIDH